MNSPLDLKKKLSYRRGERLKNCQLCRNSKLVFVRKYLFSLSAYPELRCSEIGMCKGRKYRIHPDGTCSAFGWSDPFIGKN